MFIFVGINICYMNQTFICCSTYHVYVSILEAFRHGKEGRESVLFFFDDLIEGIEPFLQNVERIGIFKAVVRIKGYTLVRRLRQQYGWKDYLLNRSGIFVDLFEKNNPELLQWDDYLRHSEINLFQINRTRAYFLIKYPQNFFRMYEDGLGTYTQKLGLLRKLNRTYITRFPLLKGHDPQVKEVLVSSPEKMTDKVLKMKVKPLDLTALEDALTPEEGRAVLSALAGGITLSDGPASLIVTQPLSEDRYCTEATKVQLYSRLAEAECASGRQVFVKTHPREVTEYHFSNQQITLLPRYFPLEVFNLDKSLKIEKGISYFSTALFNLRHVGERILLSEEAAKEDIRKIER